MNTSKFIPKNTEIIYKEEKKKCHKKKNIFLLLFHVSLGVKLDVCIEVFIPSDSIFVVSPLPSLLNANFVFSFYFQTILYSYITQKEFKVILVKFKNITWFYVYS